MLNLILAPQPRGGSDASAAGGSADASSSGRVAPSARKPLQMHSALVQHAGTVWRNAAPASMPKIKSTSDASAAAAGSADQQADPSSADADAGCSSSASMQPAGAGAGGRRLEVVGHLLQQVRPTSPTHYWY